MLSWKKLLPLIGGRRGDEKNKPQKLTQNCVLSFILKMFKVFSLLHFLQEEFLV